MQCYKVKKGVKDIVVSISIYLCFGYEKHLIKLISKREVEKWKMYNVELD